MKKTAPPDKAIMAQAVPDLGGRLHGLPCYHSLHGPLQKGLNFPWLLVGGDILYPQLSGNTATQSCGLAWGVNRTGLQAPFAFLEAPNTKQIKRAAGKVQGAHNWEQRYTKKTGPDQQDGNPSSLESRQEMCCLLVEASVARLQILSDTDQLLGVQPGFG